MNNDKQPDWQSWHSLAKKSSHCSKKKKEAKERAGKEMAKIKT